MYITLRRYAESLEASRQAAAKAPTLGKCYALLFVHREQNPGHFFIKTVCLNFGSFQTPR